VISQLFPNDQFKKGKEKKKAPKIAAVVFVFFVV